MKKGKAMKRTMMSALLVPTLVLQLGGLSVVEARNFSSHSVQEQRFAVKGQEVSKWQTISKVTSKGITIGNKTYPVSEALKQLITKGNAAALKDATVRLYVDEKGVVQGIHSLHLNNANSTFDAFGIVVDGVVVVNAPSVKLNNITIKSNLLISGKVTSEVSLKNVSVQGKAIVGNGSTPIKVNVTQSSFTNVVLERADTQLNVNQNKKIGLLQFNANAKLTGDSSVITTLIIGSKSTKIELDKPVQQLNVQTGQNIEITVKKDVAKVTINAQGKVTLQSQVKIKDVVVENKTVSLELGTTKIGNIDLPTGTTLKDVGLDASKLVGQVDTVEGSVVKPEVPPVTPPPVTPPPTGGGSTGGGGGGGGSTATERQTMTSLVTQYKADVQLKAENYTPITWTAYASELSAAEQLIANNATTEAQFKTALVTLRAKYTQLSRSFNLRVLHTNDTHSSIGNAPKLMTVLKQERAGAANSLLLDGGDVMTGTIWHSMFKGEVDAEVMNRMGYDAMTLGNHEFDFGPESLANFVTKINFPVVSANVDFSTHTGALKGLRVNAITTNAAGGKIYPAIIKEMNGEKVGIFGLTTKETSNISSPGQDIYFKDEMQTAQETADALEALGVNKIIAVNHIGNAADILLAKTVKEIDIVVGGHSHTSVTAPQQIVTSDDYTVVVQAGDNRNALGVLNVQFDKDGNIVAHNGKLARPASTNPVEDADLKQFVDQKKNDPEFIKLRMEIVAKSDVLLQGDRQYVRRGETNLGNLWTDAMLLEAKKTKPEAIAAFQNGGGIRASLPVGNFTMEEMLNVMPYSNSLVLVELKGSDIIAALDKGTTAYEMADPTGGLLHTSGVRYTFETGKPVGSRITSVEVKTANGYVPMDPNAKYWVATNSFIANGGDSLTSFTNASNRI
ncbi:MAG: bifunctional metallophosphatase/5'-nucleotidase, partial [Bacilli bacterium]